MSDILFVKTSSLGDVIHHMPALTEARRHLPHARYSWVVEQQFAPLVRLHPGIDEVIPVASRHWRRAPLKPATWQEIAAFSQALRARRYDVIIDTQGLLRSALITRHARGRRHGYDQRSIRERPASVFYDVRHAVAREPHAIERNRMLTGLALGYVPEGAIDFGLARAALARPGDYGVLFHGTARTEKEWPLERWIALARELASRRFPLVVPWGTPAEKDRSEAIAAAVPGVRVPERAPLDVMARTVAGAAFAIGVDTGLTHLAAALGVPLVAIFISSKPDLTGPMGSGPIAVVGGQRENPPLAAVLGALERVLE
jgi:lipopolysaccharide heptosyltransferase I